MVDKACLLVHRLNNPQFPCARAPNCLIILALRAAQIAKFPLTQNSQKTANSKQLPTMPTAIDADNGNEAERQANVTILRNKREDKT